ncbi:hypothetical protein C8J56DRAFT_941228 [Mycena floridula]|nr:hypothetical protein C8J56DRAFT_941228 [Mycena floridula]
MPRWPLTASPDSSLPTSSLQDATWGRRPGVNRRFTRLLVVCVISATTIILLFKALHSSIDLDPFALVRKEDDYDLPPLYEHYHEYERTLPQHDPGLPFPEGKHAKFLFFANQQYGVGWGNVMQEMFFNAQLAYTLKRARVFDNYTWDRFGEYSEFYGNIIPSRIPISTMITGPMVGGSMGLNSDVPRAVAQEYYRSQCPNPTIIRTEDIKATLHNPTATEAMAAWVKRLGPMKDRCIEIYSNARPIFDVNLFGSTGVLDIWPTLTKSPILTQFGWSSLILRGYAANRRLWEAPGTDPDSGSASVSANMSGVLAMHVRRGDFAQHCYFFSNASFDYNGFNAFPGFPDKFVVPPKGEQGNVQTYRDHCFPSIERMVQRVAEIKADMKGQGVSLRRIYMMTNGKRGWLTQFAAALREAAPGEWDSITNSRDLKLDWEQKYIAQTIDMYIGLRAQVFVGNGFSSLSSNIAMLRMAQEQDPRETRFW